MLLQTKQSIFSTFESRKNTQANGTNSRVKDFKYDINDYLPPDDIKLTNHLFSFGFGRRDDTLSITERTCKAEDSQNEWISGYKETISSLEESVREKDKQIQKIMKEGNEKQRESDQKIKNMEKQINQMLEKANKLKDQNEGYLNMLKVLEQNIGKQQKQKILINENLKDLKKDIQKKTKNIRIFCQKYEVVIVPKMKQTYTIEVQTEKQLAKTQRNIIGQSQFNLMNSKPFIKISQPIIKENIIKKAPSQFYQLYQQQNAQFQIQDLNNEITSRSQVIGSGYKPRRPFLDNQSEVVQKQNDRKKINQRLENKSFTSKNDKQKDKFKIKNEYIEICPVNEADIEAIVEGILNS